MGSLNEYELELLLESSLAGGHEKARIARRSSKLNDFKGDPLFQPDRPPARTRFSSSLSNLAIEALLQYAKSQGRTRLGEGPGGLALLRNIREEVICKT
jgi:hypothetical protein